MIVLAMIAALATAPPDAAYAAAEAASASAMADLERLHRLNPNDVRYMTNDQLALVVVCADLVQAADQLQRARRVLLDAGSRGAARQGDLELGRLVGDAEAWSVKASAEVQQYCAKPVTAN